MHTTLEQSDFLENLICLQYDLTTFCPFNTVLVDHGDPSVNTGMIVELLSFPQIFI